MLPSNRAALRRRIVLVPRIFASLRTVVRAFTLFLLAAVLNTVAAPAEDVSLEDLGRREVVSLHEFIEAWMAGSLPDTDETYARFAEAMAEDFQIISPSGALSDRTKILSAFRGAHGVRSKVFSVVIKNFRTRLIAPPLMLATYEEWQYENDAATARVSTVLIRRDAAKPGGVAWVHLHETWLPELAPPATTPAR